MEKENITLVKPLFIDGIFNHAGKRMRIKYVKTVTCDEATYDLYIRDSKIPENSYPSSGNDVFYLHVLINDWLIPIGLTEWTLYHRALQKPIVLQLYGSEEARNQQFSEFRKAHSETEADRLIHSQLAKEKELEGQLYAETKYSAAYIHSLLDKHIKSYTSCKNGIGSFPDFIGAALVGELEMCIRLSELRKENYAREREEEQKKRAEEERIQAEAEAAELALAEKVLLGGGKITNSRYICTLAEKYHIVIPLRTKGWILNSMKSCLITDNGVSVEYMKTKKGACSKKIFDIIGQLREAVQKATQADAA